MMILSKENIKGKSEEILKDEKLLKEVIKQPELVVELLKETNEFFREVEVEGKTIELVRPIVNPTKGKRNPLY